MFQIAKSLFLQASVITVLSAAFPGMGAKAANFTDADQLFKRRAEGSSVISEARTHYLNQLPSANNDEFSYAVEQVARLDAYEGLKLIDTEPTQRQQIFSRCLTDLDNYKVQQRGPAAFFYYWKSVCLAQWARANGVLESLFRTNELFGYLDSGEAIDRTYEGGGFARIRGAALAKLPPINPFGPRQDLNRSKQLLEASIASPAWGGSHTPEWDTGDYYYSTYFYLAETLVAMNRQADALQVIDDATARIDAGDIPVAREPEELLSREYMRQLKERINQ